jgi:YD repeat-containing protein
MNSGKKYKIKIMFRIFTGILIVLFVLLAILVRRSRGTVTVRLKPQAELAKLPVSTDSYPCLMIGRARASEPLRAAIQQCSPALNNAAVIEQYEVDLRSGRFTLRKTDLFIPDRMPLALTRAYRQWDDKSRAFGIGGNDSYDIFPYGDHFPYTYMELFLGDGETVHYDRISQGTSFADFLAEHTGKPPLIFEKSRIGWNRDHWDMRFADGTIYRFPEAYHAQRGVDGALVGMRDPNGDEIEFVRDARHNLVSLTSSAKHQIRFRYDEHDRIVEASDDRGNDMQYSYEPSGRLSEVHEGGKLAWNYSYDAYGMTRVQDAEGDDVVVNRYSWWRVSRMTVGKAGTYQFNYLVTRLGDVEETMVTDPAGKETTFRFDRRGH